jgi:hypothetical protein
MAIESWIASMDKRILVVAALIGSASGCGSGLEFPMASVTGTVLCEGKPVEGAYVYFEPVKTAESSLVGPQSFSFTDKSGRFRLMVNGTVDGAVVGKNRVRVGGAGVKCNCSLNEEVDLMQVDVDAKKANDFELVLKKKLPGQKKNNVGDDDSGDIK